jgi:U3 small nucleolar RNA-associated protein 13
MSPGVQFVESLEQKSLSRAFYTGGEVHSSRSSEYIYSCYNGGVSVVDSSTGETFAYISPENDPVMTFAVNPDNNMEVITVGQSLLCRHWEIVGPAEVVMLRSWSSGHMHVVNSMAISHDGSLLATGGIDKTIRVFAIPGYYPVAVYKLPTMEDPITVMRFHPTRRILASLGPEHSVLVWDLDQTSLSTPLTTLKGHMSTVHTMSFSNDGSVLVTSGNDQMVMSWDMRSKIGSLVNQVAVFESVHSVLAVTASRFITVGDKGVIRLWELKKCLMEQKSGHGSNGHLKYVSFVGSSSIVAVGVDLGMSLWSSDEKLKPVRSLSGNLGEVVSLRYIDDSRVVCAVNDEFPRIINLENFGTETKLEGHTDICLSVAVHDQLIATGSKDQTIRVWGGASGGYKCIGEFKGHTDAVTSVCFTHDGKKIISGSEDTTVKVWRVSGGKPIIRSIMGHAKGVNVVAVSRNDKYIASGSQDRTAKIFALEDGQLIGACTGHKRGIWSVDFSPIEQVLATSSGDATIKLWNISAPGTPCIRSFDLHDHSVLNCRFLASGLQLISADAIGSMRLWNVRTGECLQTSFMTGESINATIGSKKESDKKTKLYIEEFENESEEAAKIWALDFSPSETGFSFAVGTAAGSIAVWADNTALIEEVRKTERTEKAQKDTAINVLVKAGMFSDAFRTAFELNRPKQMIEVIQQAGWMVNEDVARPSSKINLTRFIRANITSDNAKSKLLGMIKDWAKSARTAPIAYQLLTQVVASADAKNNTNETLSSSLAVLAEKHLARLTSLNQKCYILDAILIASDPNNVKKIRLE